MSSILVIVFVSGCHHASHSDATPNRFANYRAENFDGGSVQRVLFMPLTNESPNPRAADEIRTALAAELQQGGRVDVIVPPLESPQIISAAVRLQGRFDEAQLVALGKSFQADAVLCGAVTHYHPYAPPSIGLSLRLISTRESVVISSVDGLWDARDAEVAKQAHAFFASEIADDPHGSGCDAILRSPRLYQKFVCSGVARALCATLHSPTVGHE